MKPKLLLTGASGFIGSHLYEALKDDFEVTSIKSLSKNNDHLSLNLLNNEKCKDYFKDKNFDIIIHAAAIAHGKNQNHKMSIGEANILMTKNIFDHINVAESVVIFISSVSVYGLENNKEKISVNDLPIPVTDYGKSKLICEEILQKLTPKHLHILRLTPVYSENNLSDLGKRVFLPILKIPFLTKQERIYSLCHVKQVVESVKNSIGIKKNTLVIIKDFKDLDQKEILSFFKNITPKIIINRSLIEPILYILKLFRISKARLVRDMFYKLFFSVRYSNH